MDVRRRIWIDRPSTRCKPDGNFRQAMIRLALIPAPGPHDRRCRFRSVRRGRRHQWDRNCRGCSGARTVCGAGGNGGSGERHIVGQFQADPRRLALSRALRVSPGARGIGRARSAAGEGAASDLAATLYTAARARRAPALDGTCGFVSLRQSVSARRYPRLSRARSQRRPGGTATEAGVQQGFFLLGLLG